MHVYTNSSYIHYCQLYKRYIDDIIMIWTGTIESLMGFCGQLNSAVPTIKFTMIHDPVRINFLDVTIQKENGYLKTDLYKKETDHNSLLQYSSFHPPSLKNNLPKTQCKRVKRITTDEHKGNIRMEEMKNRFLQRGYPEALLDACMQEVKDIPKNKLIEQKEKKETQRLAFVSKFNVASNNICKIITKHWHILQRCVPHVPAFVEFPLMAYQRGSSYKSGCGIIKERSTKVFGNSQNGNIPLPKLRQL
ncbi:hypothetical protein XELAEV_18027379mg [Xenopus laevis]|uniref:Helix-turn-helix domain-containing protein n=1 Tax=Xenopus laevis TaxID=8355 RepID=A0A974HJL2_XENLA|nr:hypothetical protein XELAEV_18027379mg [Xenopus laevis]